MIFCRHLTYKTFVLLGILAGLVLSGCAKYRAPSPPPDIANPRPLVFSHKPQAVDRLPLAKSKTTGFGPTKLSQQNRIIYSHLATPGGLPVEPPPTLPGSPDILGDLTGPSSMGLFGGCRPHYLLDIDGLVDGNGKLLSDQPTRYNSFTWWDKTPPATGPIEKQIKCEFSTALARVVGANSSELRQLGFKITPWDASQHQRAHDVPAVEFAVRARRPVSDPLIRTYNPGGLSSAPNVLVNEVAPGHELTLRENEFRPSLWFDFAVPQRAVGLEYGYLALPGRPDPQTDKYGVVLVARDGNGDEIATVRGRDLVVDIVKTNLTRTKLTNTIGVRDRHGRIRSVELRFEYTRAHRAERGEDPGDKMLEPQVVARIWHEPLPPAAVVQGLVGKQVGDDCDPTVGLCTSYVFADLFGRPPGPRSHSLPFRFDRALAMLRGFHFEFLRPQPQAVKKLVVGVTPTDLQAFQKQESGQGAASTLASRTISLDAIGDMTAGPGYHPYRVVAYYTLLAWDSDQVALDSSAASDGRRSLLEFVSNDMTVPDPCAVSGYLSRADRNAACGRLHGAIQKLGYHKREAQEIEQIDAVIGAYREGGSSTSLQRTAENGDPTVRWKTWLGFVGDGDDDQYGEVIGAVTTGVSLGIGPSGLADLSSDEQYATRGAFNGLETLPSLETGRRLSSNDYIFPVAGLRGLGMSWPIPGDVAFLSLSTMLLKPDGPIKELNAEVRGEAYNGKVIEWKAGAGIRIHPPITGGTGGGSQEENLAGVPVPSFAAVRRKPVFTEPRAAASNVHFWNGIAGIRKRGADVVGFLRNAGSEPMLITRLINVNVAQGDPWYFDLDFLVPGDAYYGTRSSLPFVRLSEALFKNRLPLLLNPGAEITITGDYIPQTPSGTGGEEEDEGMPTGHAGMLLFSMKKGSGNASKIVQVSGSARAANPNAEWRPNALTFRPPYIGGVGTLTAVIVSTGETPLVINNFFLRDADPSINFQLGHLLESDALGVRINCGGANACNGSAVLVADTNAGLIELPISVRRLR